MPVFVIGSCNTDMVVKSDRLPLRGETVIGETFFMNPGGKGANQAVAAARLGGNVTFVARIGDDIFGRQMLKQLGNENIRTPFVYTDRDHPSGVALIGVDAAGDNFIIVAPGSNHYLTEREVSAALDSVDGPAIVLLQLEIAPATVDHAIREAHARNMKIVLNPAPAGTISSDLFTKLFLITPNETEAGLLTGIPVIDDDSTIRAAAALHKAGVSNVIVTLGKRGVYLSGETGDAFIPAPVTKAVDTTAAGDCFNGALTVALAAGRSLEEAARFGCSAASLSVTRMGAQSSMPYLQEIEPIKN